MIDEPIRPANVCAYPGCDETPVLGVGVLDAPPTWVCAEHVADHVAGVSDILEAVMRAAGSRN